MVLFALSPSGRALMLTVPQTATVLHAKAQLAVGCVRALPGTRDIKRNNWPILCYSQNAPAEN